MYLCCIPECKFYSFRKKGNKAGLELVAHIGLKCWFLMEETICISIHFQCFFIEHFIFSRQVELFGNLFPMWNFSLILS